MLIFIITLLEIAVVTDVVAEVEVGAEAVAELQDMDSDQGEAMVADAVAIPVQTYANRNGI